ncbi:hypothetical protein M3Y99_00677600 [Aphelenchoides fujianensis]|nr:hypothetical protein M3Y99_00677400 [Aphelenchoides fujianensis]KAI6238539.1 hypothetical protein M3Y99_00677600 [Aphelenchoides fujianensis]
MSRMTASFKWILGFLATGALMFLFLVNLRAFHSPSNFFDQSRAFQGFHFSSALNATGDPLHECVLPKIDPWDPEVLRLVDPSHDPLRGCKPTFVRRSRVKDGLLLVNQTAAQLRDGEKCFFRCLLPVDDWALEFGEWLPVGANGSRPQCDVFDVQCNQTNTTTYKFLHTQIREQPPSKVKPPAGSPDVYVIVLDSVSISQVFRSMPVTTHFLRAEMDAVFFPYANKVGLNSAPNGYGFLVGEQAENSLPNPWGKADLKGRWDELCKRPLEKENTIVADFRNRGYRMMMVEDWANGVTTYPNCIGFASPPVDHFMKPFAVRYDGENKYKDWETRSFLFEKLCLETYHYQGAEWNKTTDFSATSFVPSNRTLLGSSLLHPLPQPRTCESLHIPFQYCLCQHEFSLVEDESIAVRVAELAVAKMNEEIARSEYRDNCTRLSVDREQTARLELQEFKPQGGRRIFRVNFRLLPSGGLYDTFAEMTGDSIRLIAENFPRRDSYEKQANCIPENFIRNYCFCPQSSA